MATKVHRVPDGVLKAARKMAKANLQAEENITEILLAPVSDRVLLVEVDPTALPNSELGAVPLYFRPAPAEGIPLPSGIVIVTPKEASGRIPLPAGWGQWEDLIRIWPKRV